MNEEKSDFTVKGLGLTPARGFWMLSSAGWPSTNRKVLSYMEENYHRKFSFMKQYHDSYYIAERYDNQEKINDKNMRKRMEVEMELDLLQNDEVVDLDTSSSNDQTKI